MNKLLVSPPKTRISFNAGITGHRSLPKANETLLCQQIESVLHHIKKVTGEVHREIAQLHTEDPPVLRLITMLAEGSDRIAAKCALKNDFRLQCPLPMGIAEYEKDFETADSREEFHQLISQAERILKIESCTKVRSRAYQNSGQIMLGHSDLLIAIWDGLDSGKVGGTSDMVEQAKQLDIPVVWIESEAPHKIHFLYGHETEQDWSVELTEAVRNLLIPWKAEEKNRNFPEAYFKEHIGKTSHFKLYNHLTSQLSFHSGKKENRKKDESFPKDKFYTEHYQSHYYCADELAKFYRDLYRSCGVLRQFLPFLASIGLSLGFYAVLFGGPNGAPPGQKEFLDLISNIGFLLQAFCFILIIVLSKIEHRFHWHQKFVDYRALSELLRQMDYLGQSGLVIRGLRVPAFNRNVSVSWINWQFRAIVREAGLPSGTLDKKRIKEYTENLNHKILQGQIEYHHDNTLKMQLITRRLERFAMTIYYIGVLIVALRVGVHILTTGDWWTRFGSDEKSYISTFFNMLSMVIPLFSALAFGLSSQQGFDRIGQLSEAMSEKLENISQQLNTGKEKDFYTYMKFSQHTADLMLSEFTDWNSFIKSKNISDH